MSIILAAAIGLATDIPGSSVPRGMTKMSIDETRRLEAYFGDCVVKRQPKLALEFVLRQGRVSTARDALEQMEAASKLAIENCVLRPSDTATEVGLKLPGNMMLYVLANSLFKRNFAARPPLGNLEQIPQSQQGAFLDNFGDCIVRRDAQSVHTLLRTKVVSAEEDNAFAALQPAMRNCLVANSTVKLNKAIVRGAVAYNYILLANAARTQLAAGASK